MSREDYQARCKSNIARAEAILKNHQFTRLTAPGCAAEVWRCKRPDTTNYGFDLTISRFGIAMFGDTGALVFNVGASYGLPFLAGDDVEYYIHSKLEQCCKETELDEDHYQEVLNSYVVRRLEQEDDLMFPQQDGMPHDTYHTILADWIYDQYQQSDVMSDRHDLFYGLHDLMGHNASPSTAQEAHETLSDNAELLGVEYDWDHDFEQPAGHLISRLYMLRYAAQQILKIKNPAPGSALAEVGSMGEEVAA